MDEDCLFVNVYKPSNATAQSKLPVWVYIQGGGYAAMGNPNYNGTEVVSYSGGNIVQVNFNYRVGALGFLASDEVRKDGELNVGLLDQRFLLSWVKQHISKFGGDPEHVVISGSSAGGGSVSHHLTAYGGKDHHRHFIGAVLESPFWPTLRTVEEMEWQYTRLLNMTNCSSLSCLRNLTASALQAQSYGTTFPGTQPTDPNPLFYWLPVIDGGFVPDQLYNLFEQGRFADVPLIAGHTTNEGSWFANNASTADEVSAFLRSNYPHLTSSQLDTINQFYPKMDTLPMHNPYFPSASAAYGDATFTCPSSMLVSSVARFLDPKRAWGYWFNVIDAGNTAAGVGVFHTFEVQAVFGPGQTGWTVWSLYNTNAAIVPVTMGYWVSFVRDLNPNTYKADDAPTWEPWGDGFGRQIRLQTNATAMVDIEDSQTQNCMLWKSLAPTMEV
ncbi:Lipase 1 [Penicillium subrubescens]|uniref:Carboxylic ester hydrolase n=2 Tax=Penicillium subrubescens TaxID=1316194 RepID=A0A1Q5U3B5_9EURO|nr:Lipase 1 [Penicillium subrubescens]